MKQSLSTPQISNPETSAPYFFLFQKFEHDGLIKRNKNRALTKNRTKEFSMQLQFWTKLGIISGSTKERYKTGYRLNFHDNVIKEIMESPDFDEYGISH